MILEIIGVVLGVFAVSTVAALFVARFMRVGKGPSLCSCGCGRTLPADYGWDGYHGN